MTRIVGICGGFRAFPTCSAEIVTPLQQGKADRAALYVSPGIAAGVLAILAGIMVGCSMGWYACAAAFGITTETCYS